MYENPVLWKEVKTRFRSRHARVVQLAVGLPIAGLILWIYYEALTGLLSSGGSSGARDGWSVGVALQTVLIWLLSPALAANAITQEREQQTWEMLVFSLLTPSEIVIGKFCSRVLPVVGVLLAFLPYMAACFFLASGAISLADALLVYLVFGTWVLFLVTTSLFCSSVFRKTAAALGTSYVVAFCLVLGTVLISMIVDQGQVNEKSFPMWFNPVEVAAALLDRRSNELSGSILLANVGGLLTVTAAMFLRMVTRFRSTAKE